MYFGKYIKKLRLEKGLSLRTFCNNLKLDPSNWSKIERGRLKPKISRKQYTWMLIELRQVGKPQAAILRAFYLWDNLLGKIKPFTEEEIINSLPVLVKLTENQKEQLIKLIKEQHNGRG